MHDLRKEQELDDMKLDFITMAAHELRTPLTSMRGYISVILTTNKGNFSVEQLEFLNRMNISCDRLGALIENLLFITRIEKGNVTLHVKPLDWINNVKQEVMRFSGLAKDNGITLTVKDPDVTLPEIAADKYRINEVFANLVSNAINFTNSGGNVTVWFEKGEHELITHIQDTGRGIPSESLPRLFTKFFRISDSLTQESKGTGLGLYISKSIVGMHHGKIWVESKLNEGSTFSFSLPVYRKTQE